MTVPAGHVEPSRTSRFRFDARMSPSAPTLALNSLLSMLDLEVRHRERVVVLGVLAISAEGCQRCGRSYGRSLAQPGAFALGKLLAPVSARAAQSEARSSLCG